MHYHVQKQNGSEITSRDLEALRVFQDFNGITRSALEAWFFPELSNASLETALVSAGFEILDNEPMQ